MLQELLSELSLLQQESLEKRCSSSIQMDKVVLLPKEPISFIDLSIRLPTVLRVIFPLTYMQGGTVMEILLKDIPKHVMIIR